MRLYLDNCCFNRPYDDQSQVRVQLETLAKLHVNEPFDYTEWRRDHFEGMDVRELSKAAMASKEDGGDSGL